MAHKDIEKQRAYDRKYKEKRRANDPELKKKERERAKEYYKNNRDQVLKQKAERYANDSEFRARKKARNKKYYAEAPWLSHIKAAKERCNNPNSKDYKYYGGKGIRMLLTNLEVGLLYKCDHADKMEQPSIDRINSNGDYIFGNCRFIEKSENIRRKQ